jgi:hypothetical protein
MMTDKMFATEQRNYWCAVGELNEAIRGEEPQDVIDYHLEEIEAIWMNTEQPLLRERCAEILQKFNRLKQANA